MYLFELNRLKKKKKKQKDKPRTIAGAAEV